MKIKRFVSVALAALLLVILALPPQPAEAVTQAEIDALEAQRDEVKARQAEVREQLDSLQSDRSSLTQRKAALDEENELLRQDLALIGEQIEAYDALIMQKHTAAEAAAAEEDAQYARYRQRVRAMEEQGDWGYIAFVLDAENLSDLLARVNDISDIISHDQSLREDYIAARERAEAAVAEYEAVQERQKEKRAELVTQQEELESQISAAGWLIRQLEDDIDYYEEFYDQVEAEKEAIQKEIDEKAAALKKQQEEEAARRAAAAAAASQPAASSVYVSSGYYAWPANTTYITSPFGYRVHPIYGTSRLHSGTDIGASYGSPVTAAAAGSVITAVLDYGTTGYGTYVAIYHDNGTTTLYGHMSSLAVSQGDYVSQGQVIGYVGSTGASTGPHLHFEVRINGSCVDPMQYFS
ncbi:MAG: peptidoglycan DD-metalloendopeptidase family protein [Oscillospiraceae bacterium]|nr:peptidoglycan DD-metalloendopeptidase family protein [Oscillospiraceae bacterium]